MSYYQGDGYRDGSREHGYLLVITDAAGTVQHLDSNPEGMQKDAKQIMTLVAPGVLDRSFKVLPNATFPATIELAR